MKFISDHLSMRTLTLSVSLISALSICAMANATVYPVEEVRYGTTSGNTVGKVVAESEGPVMQMNLTAAARNGVISAWQYSYNPSMTGNIDPYEQFLTSTESYMKRNVSTGQGFVLDSTQHITNNLAVWDGFWLRSNYYTTYTYDEEGILTGTQVYKKLALTFDYPNSYDPTHTQSITLPDKWRIISIPLVPSSIDFSAFTFDRWVNGSSAVYPNGNGTGNATYYGYFVNDKDMTVSDFLPGRAFWATTRATGVLPRTLTLSGSNTPSNHTFYGEAGQVRQYGLKIDSDVTDTSDKHGDYLVGNPFQVEYPVKKVWVEVNGDYTGLNSAKIAASDLNEIQTWSIDMQLTDTTGSRIDAGNSAGVLETGSDLHELFSTSDMVAPKADYIRLAFVNPEDASTPLCYDFRAPGQDKYEWTVELSTSISSIDTKLGMYNFKSIPSYYSVTLTDTQTGEVYSLTGDSSFDVTLTSTAPKTYILTATRQKTTAVEDAAPTAVALKNIYPNPFNPSTTISFDLKKAGMVNLSIYNISGQLVDTLVNANMTAGSHNVVWNATKHSSGVYLVRMTSNGFTDTKKVTFMK